MSNNNFKDILSCMCVSLFFNLGLVLTSLYVEFKRLYVHINTVFHSIQVFFVKPKVFFFSSILSSFTHYAQGK